MRRHQMFRASGGGGAGHMMRDPFQIQNYSCFIGRIRFMPHHQGLYSSHYWAQASECIGAIHTGLGYIGYH